MNNNKTENILHATPMSMIKKSLLIWLAIIPITFLNLVLLEVVIDELVDTKHALPLSVILLCLMIFTLCWFCIPLIGRGTSKTYWIIGLLWAVLSFLFPIELGLMMGHTFINLIKIYDITSGNFWLLVILFIGITPWLTAKIRRKHFVYVNSKKIKCIIGIILILINILWSIYSIYFLYSYHFRGGLWCIMIPDWILITNAIIGIIGVFINVMMIKNKISIIKTLIINILILKIGFFLYL